MTMFHATTTKALASIVRLGPDIDTHGRSHTAAQRPLQEQAQKTRAAGVVAAVALQARWAQALVPQVQEVREEDGR